MPPPTTTVSQVYVATGAISSTAASSAEAMTGAAMDAAAVAAAAVAAPLTNERLFMDMTNPFFANSPSRASLCPAATVGRIRRTVRPLG